MVAAYYTKGYNSHDLFDKLEIVKMDSYENHLNQHNVIYIDFSRRPSTCNSLHDFIQWVSESLIEDIEEMYSCKIKKAESIDRLLIRTKQSYVFILDEWDSIFYESYIHEEDKIEYLRFLKGILKDQPYVELAYMTGVLPISYSASELQLNTRDEILSAMVVFGFLSYYDGMLHIPNHELMMKFETMLSRNSMGEVKEIVKQSKEMLETTLSGDEGKVAAILEEIHDREIPFLKYNDENSLSCVITLSYLKARDYYDIIREDKAGKGYADFLFIPKKRAYPPIVLEIKFNVPVENAIQQIKEKNYMQKVKKYPEYLLVGISYNEKKHHQCKIEKVVNKVI